MTQLLTDAEIRKAFDDIPIDKYDGLISIARAIEAAVLDRLSKQEPVAWVSGHLLYALEKMQPYIPLAIEVSLVNLNWKNQIPLFAAPVPPDPRIAELEAALLEQVDLTIQLRDQLNSLRASLDPSRE